MDTKQKILDFITDIYKKSNWPYVTVAAIINHIGKYPKKELNELYSEGKIKVRDSVKGKLIELIINDEAKI